MLQKHNADLTRISVMPYARASR